MKFFDLEFYTLIKKHAHPYIVPSGQKPAQS